jgi:hypothetical protein
MHVLALSLSLPHSPTVSIRFPLRQLSRTGHDRLWKEWKRGARVTHGNANAPDPTLLTTLSTPNLITGGCGNRNFYLFSLINPGFHAPMSGSTASVHTVKSTVLRLLIVHGIFLSFCIKPVMMMMRRLIYDIMISYILKFWGSRLTGSGWVVRQS